MEVLAQLESEISTIWSEELKAQLNQLRNKIAADLDSLEKNAKNFKKLEHFTKAKLIKIKHTHRLKEAASLASQVIKALDEF